MTDTASQMHSQAAGDPIQREAKVCPCGELFVPRRPWQRFHSSACRNAWHSEHGHTARVRSVRRLARGISIVVHSDDEALLALVPGDVVRVDRV